jgi:transcriptional regulator of acetoin/glycerol metabolism
LQQFEGNISRAAEAMGVSRQLLHRLLDRHGIRAK